MTPNRKGYTSHDQERIFPQTFYPRFRIKFALMSPEIEISPDQMIEMADIQTFEEDSPYHILLNMPDTPSMSDLEISRRQAIASPKSDHQIIKPVNEQHKPSLLTALITVKCIHAICFVLTKRFRGGYDFKRI